MRAFVLLPLIAAGAMLSGCVEAPPPRPHRVVEQVPPPEQVTQVVVYPANGQPPEQLDRDRYECHNWAVKQTGFDPSAPGVPARQRVVVMGPPPPPPGSGVAAGAITGAVLGAIVGGPWHSGTGAAVGAVAGAAVGGVAESAQRDAARDAQDRAIAQAQAPSAAWEQRASAYRRAISACLEGRGYTVK